MTCLSQAMERCRSRGMVLIVDDPDREHEGDLMVAAECITPQQLVTMSELAGGVICLALTPERLNALQLPLLPTRGHAPLGAAFTLPIDLKEGLTTGTSAIERARTIRAAASPQSVASEFITPGHVFPLAADPLGVIGRQGHTEASIALAAMSGWQPAAVICEVMERDGSMMRTDGLRTFSAQHAIPMVTVSELHDAWLQHVGPSATSGTTQP